MLRYESLYYCFPAAINYHHHLRDKQAKKWSSTTCYALTTAAVPLQQITPEDYEHNTVSFGINFQSNRASLVWLFLNGSNMWV